MTLNPEQFYDQAMDIIRRSRGMIQGEDAKTVFRAANIRFWPLKETPTTSGREFGLEPLESIGGVSSKEVLNTAQNHLHGPTIREYMNDGPPEEDPDVEGRKYLPEVYTSTRGRKWIEEGHHRLVASRLRGDYGTEVYELEW